MVRVISISMAWLALAAASAHAQSTSFQGAVAGYVYDRASQSVRPLMGIAGAAYAGSPVLSGIVDRPFIAPDGRWALIHKAGHYTFLHDLTGPVPTQSVAEGLIDSIDRVVWSANGSFALLYSSSGNQLQRVQLSGDIVADTPIDLSAWGQASIIAMDPAGQQLVFGIPGSGLYLFAAGQSPALVAPMLEPAAAAFDETGDHLYAIDLDKQQIVEIDHGSAAFPFTSLAQPDGSNRNPVAIAISKDSRYLLVPDRATRTVCVYETASQNLVKTIPLDFAPSRLDMLSTAPTFLLNEGDQNQWLLVLDGGAEPSVYFIPALSQEAL